MHGVELSPEFNEEFTKLQSKAEKGEGEAKYLMGIVDKGIAKLAMNIEAGKKIPRKLWPKIYIQKYGINNLWKLNLDSYWRMIYTIVGKKVELISIILEVMDHPSYSKRFGYKK